MQYFPFHPDIVVVGESGRLISAPRPAVREGSRREDFTLEVLCICTAQRALGLSVATQIAVVTVQPFVLRAGTKRKMSTP